MTNAGVRSQPAHSRGVAPRVAGACALALLALCAQAAADVLELANGSRFDGTLIEQTPDAILFEVVLGGGGAPVQTWFPRSRVARVRVGRSLEQRAPAPAPVEIDESSRKRQMIREAIELIADGASRAALRALQRVLTDSTPEQLAALEPFAIEQTGSPLIELIADLRMKTALDVDEGRGFRLDYVSRYESGAVARRLRELGDALVNSVHRGRTLESWSWSPEEYGALAGDSVDFVRDARRAAAILAARLKYDETVRSDRAVGRAISAQRARLARLSARIAALPGFTGLGAGFPADDPTATEAERIRHEAAEARAEEPPLESDVPEEWAASQPTEPPADEAP